MANTRREFLGMAAAFGAAGIWATAQAAPSKTAWRENRALFPEGVASGDPDPHSVILWTRHPSGSAVKLTVEVAEDEAFQRVVARDSVTAAPDAGCTARALVGNLKPSKIYWYRFTDADGNGSRIGRTMTAPALGDARKAKFAFVSCQNVNMGYLQAWRRMIHDDKAAAQPIEFVVHLGDFIYEIFFQPSENPNGYGGNPLRPVPTYPTGEKQNDRWIPTRVEDYRVCYQHYLSDPDLQDARARWPFICMWDNHEFSQSGWQSFQQFGGKTFPAQTRKVAAMQAWFEFIPARIIRDGKPLQAFTPPKVADAPITAFGAGGLGLETNNLIAINSLKGYRRQHWGANFELIITDQRSYRAEDPQDKTPDSFNPPAFRSAVPQKVLEVLDAGRDYPNAPDTISVFGKAEKNVRKNAEAFSMLGLEQRAWFLEALKTSKAPWKIWATSQATMDDRLDFQNLPADYPAKWGADDYGVTTGDYGTAYHERAVVYDFVRDQKLTGFVAISGDRHTFVAGRASAKLPPDGFAPVGVSFTGGSISTPSPMDGWRHMKPTAPMRSLLLGPGDAAKAAPLANMLYIHGVKSALEFNKSGDVAKAKALSNPQQAPGLNFLDLEGHGFALVTTAPHQLDCEFVAIPQPLAATDAPDGGPLRYRVLHTVPLWQPGEAPKLQQTMLEGEAPFST